MAQSSSSDSPSYTGMYGSDSSVPQTRVEQAPDQAVSSAGSTAMVSNMRGGGPVAVVTGLSAYAQAAGAKQKALSSQAASQAAGLPTRNAPSDGNPNYHGMTSVQLSNGVKGANAAPSHESSEAWNAIGNALVHVNQTLSSAASSASSGWQGAAAKNAMRFHTQVANWTNTTAAGAQVASVNLYNQSNAVSSAQTSMPAPYTYTMTQAYQDVSTAPDPVAAVPNAMANLNKASENQQQSAQVATSYQQNLIQSSQKMPAMPPTPTFNAGNASGSARLPGGSGGGAATGSGSGGGAGFTPRLGSSSGANGSSGGGSGSGGGGKAILPPGARGTGGGSGQSGSNLPGQNGGGLNTQGYNPSGPYSGPGGNGLTLGGGPSGGGMPIAAMPMSGNFGGYGGGGGSGGGYGTSGGASGGSAGGLGRGSGFGPGGSGSSSSGSGSSSSSAGGRSSAGAASAEDSAIESGAAGTRGGAAGGMGAGRGGSKGQGDSEHKRAAYLVEADPDSIFGTDERTAPPVIGG
ncbi:MAG TPA: hypothetical protein VGM75_28675 [Pseudonocardiaceae bacterium]